MEKDPSLLVGHNSFLPDLCYQSLVPPLWFLLLSLDFPVVAEVQVGLVDEVAGLHPVHILLVGPFV